MSKEIWSSKGKSNDDVWDDTELIKMYEQSVSSTYKKVSPTESSISYTTPDGKKYTWTVGQKCMAPYKDGEDSNAEVEWFPAKIQWIGGNNAQEVGVIFEEYGNEETVHVKDLWDESEMEELEEKQATRSHSKTSQRGEKKKNSNPRTFPSTSSRLPTLAPPPPPGLLSMVPPDEVEALSSMLMSWYMSGYHTGYYQAMTDQKVRNTK